MYVVNTMYGLFKYNVNNLINQKGILVNCHYEYESNTCLVLTLECSTTLLHVRHNINAYIKARVAKQEARGSKSPQIILMGED